MKRDKTFSFCMKFALILLVFTIVMMFIVPVESAEFYVLIFTAIILLIMVIYGFIKVRIKEK